MMESHEKSVRSWRLPARLIAGEAAYILLFVILLFVPAGTVLWPRGWILLASLAANRIVGLVRLYRLSPALLAERAQGPLQPGQTLADKLLLPTFMASYAGLVAFAAADCFRLDLLGHTSTAASIVGLLGILAGGALVTQALCENAYATMVVRHQAEREQRVVDTGVYGRVRHPMYAGLVLIMLGVPSWLGSVAGVVASIVPIGVLIVRILHEEQLLASKLHGYDQYKVRVRSRLIPGIW